MLSSVTMIQHTSAMQMEIPSSGNRSTSLSQKISGIKLFCAIARKLARKSKKDIAFGKDVDSCSSSSDSCSSTSAGPCRKSKKGSQPDFQSTSSGRISSSSSNAGSDGQSVKHRHLALVENFRRAFHSLSLSTNGSHSSSSSKEAKRKNLKKSSPKRILRSPVTYIYFKGLSGLPTQRVPRTPPRMCFNGSCGYSVQYMTRLH